MTQILPQSSKQISEFDLKIHKYQLIEMNLSIPVMNEFPKNAIVTVLQDFMFVAKPRNLRRLWLLYSSKPPKYGTLSAETIFEQIGQTHYQSKKLISNE